MLNQRKLIISNCAHCPFFYNDNHWRDGERCTKLNKIIERKLNKTNFTIYPIPDECPLEKNDT